MAIVSLVLAMLLYFDGLDWLIPGTASYLILGLLIYRGNKQIFPVPDKTDQGSTHDTLQVHAAELFHALCSRIVCRSEAL